MSSSECETSQISETLADVTVHLADVEMPVEDLAGGVLVIGQTSAGKTRSVMNNLARQFAEMFSRCAKSIREQRQFAIVYLGVKGRGHLDFVESLSKRRRGDVVTISNKKDCPWVVRLFKRACWPSMDELNLAVVAFIEEVAERISRSRLAYKHDPFWDRQRVRVLSELARLEPRSFLQGELIDSPLSELMHDDALVALLARAEAFVDFVGEKASSHRKGKGNARAAALRQELKQHGFTGTADLKRAEKLVTFFGRSSRNEQRPKVKALCEFLASQLRTAGEAKSTGATTLLDRFAILLDSASRQRLHKLVEQWWRIPDVTRGVIEADLHGVIQAFRTGPAEQIFLGKQRREITIEEVIHRGLILVIDLPAADGGGANMPALVALKLAITQRLVSRCTALFESKALSRRGVVVVQDEAQILLSDSEAKALSVIREYGVIWLLASQSVSLIASVLRSHTDVAAFVASARVRVWGHTGDDYTAEIASRFCGSWAGIPRRLARLWHPTPLLEAAVTGLSSADTPLVPPRRLFELRTGQFFLNTARNETHFLDLRESLPKPTSRNLRQRSAVASVVCGERSAGR